MPHGVRGNGLILRVHQPFVLRMETKVTDRREVRPLLPYLISIDHKLNVARYNAGLIVALAPEDFGRHYYSRGVSTSSGTITTIEYTDRVAYYARDWEQYALGLLFFIDSFAAAAFSLLDSCGHLLNTTYNLSIPEREASFVRASAEIRAKAPRMYAFLEKYLSSNPNCFDWMKLLRRLRNHTTHSHVTDVVQLITPTPPEPEQLQLKSTNFGETQDRDLKVFIEQAFSSLEDFTEQLYEKVTIQVEAEKKIPISGREDHLV